MAGAVTVKTAPLGITLYNQQGIEEIEIVLRMVNCPLIGRNVTAAQCRIPVDVVGMPITKMFDIRMSALDVSEHLFLVFSVLKEA